ncbi:interleukin-12 receptor subunit beta-1 [Alligator sinensis]|uniref:Interleukin-12 receptor subunit beta-1 n=1 Tax=Alligator sinensis TaxID=38654 RepID=A0A3Q0H261_ALLSI|nr:interleukin-12 receptor subunit beta-1 [Alligator sinensis]
MSRTDMCTRQQVWLCCFLFCFWSEPVHAITSLSVIGPSAAPWGSPGRPQSYARVPASCHLCFEPRSCLRLGEDPASGGTLKRGELSSEPTKPFPSPSHGNCWKYDAVAPAAVGGRTSPERSPTPQREPGWPQDRSGSADHPDLLCYRRCNRCDLHCSWTATAPLGNATYRFKYCYHSIKNYCTAVEASTMHYTLPFRKLYLLKNFTAWAELGSGDRTWRTRNITLQLENAIKLDPPPSKISFSKVNGTLRLQLPRAEERAGKAVVLRREVRHRQGKDTTWTLVECETQEDDNKESKDEAVTCDLGQTAALELQIRHKTLHWSSTWSDWSQIILVPAELVERPRASYTLGRLGQSGRRNLTLQWQKASEEQGNVTYTVAVRMLTCGCGEPAAKITLQDVVELNLALSGAEYSISLSAANAAGCGPAWPLHIPPDPDTEISFLAVSAAGTNTTVQWAAKANGTFYCIEKQLLGDNRRPADCIQKPFVETGTYTETGVLEPRRCYRIAIHGQGPGRSWATFAATYHFTGTATLDGLLHITVTEASASLQWQELPLARCPGALQKYVVCCAAERDNITACECRALRRPSRWAQRRRQPTAGLGPLASLVPRCTKRRGRGQRGKAERRAKGSDADHEANASVTHFTLRGLQPGTSYRVGIQAVTARAARTCRPQHLFTTKELGSQLSAVKANLWFLAIFVVVPVSATLYHVTRKRAKSLLCPLLPKPGSSEAVKFPAPEMSQAKPQPGFLEPSENIDPTELLVTELVWDKEVPEASAETCSLLRCTVADDPAGTPPAEEGWAGGEAELPFEYRQQELLPRMGEAQGGCAGGCGRGSPGDEVLGRRLHTNQAPVSCGCVDTAH